MFHVTNKESKAKVNLLWYSFRCCIIYSNLILSMDVNNLFQLSLCCLEREGDHLAILKVVQYAILVHTFLKISQFSSKSFAFN